MNNTGIRWIAKTINIDIDTGERITTSERQRNYIIIKYEKHAYTTNKLRTSGIIEHTYKCRKNPQIRIF